MTLPSSSRFQPCLKVNMFERATKLAASSRSSKTSACDSAVCGCSMRTDRRWGLQATGPETNVQLGSTRTRLFLPLGSPTTSSKVLSDAVYCHQRALSSPAVERSELASATSRAISDVSCSKMLRSCCLTLAMSGNWRRAKRAGSCPLDQLVRPHLGLLLDRRGALGGLCVLIVRLMVTGPSLRPSRSDRFHPLRPQDHGGLRRTQEVDQRLRCRGVI